MSGRDSILLHQYRNLNFWLASKGPGNCDSGGNKRNFEWKFALGVSIGGVQEDKEVLSMKDIEDRHPSLPDSSD